MRTVPVILFASLFIAGTVSAKDLLTQSQYIDYSAQVKCAEQQYAFSDPDRYEKELARIEKSFGIKEKDIESGRMDELSARYDADPATYDAIEEKRGALCPQPD